MGGNAVRPVQWYGTSPITLRPGTVSIPRGGPPVSVDRLGIFWRVGLFSHSRLRRPRRSSRNTVTPHTELSTAHRLDGTPRWCDSSVDASVPRWTRFPLSHPFARSAPPSRLGQPSRSPSRGAVPVREGAGSRKAIGTNVIETVQINVLHARAGPTRASRDLPVAGRASRPGHRGRDEITT